MKFFIVVGKNALYTYEYDGQNYQVQYIEGSEVFSIDPNNIMDDIKLYIRNLANEKNLRSTESLEFDILESPNIKFNLTITEALKMQISNRYSLNTILEKVFAKLSENKELLIDEYGINYEGYSYMMKNNTISEEQYNLLAYTIHSDDLIKEINV